MLLNNITIPSSEDAKLQERVRISFLRNRADFDKIVKDTALPREFIIKCLTKFKKSCKYETNKLVADQIIQHLLFGYASRIEQLNQIISKLEEVEKHTKSSCHHWAIRTLVDLDVLGNKQYECLKCGELCDIYESLNEEALNQKMTAIDMLRKEDSEMVRFAEKLGYTNKEELPPSIINNTQNIVVMPNSTGKIDDNSAKELEQLKPVEMEQLRQRIESGLLEAEIVEANG